jgi:transposase
MNMQGQKSPNQKLFYQFSLAGRVPEDNFYRRLKSTLDLSFLKKKAAPFYGKCGQESIDTVVFFKMLLVGYLENILHDRKLIEFCSMRMDVLYFLDYDIDESLPWHSTISRTRKLFGKELFEELFNKVLELCINKGMVAGHTQAVDAAFVKANASLDSLEVKKAPSDSHSYVDQSFEVNEEPKRKAKNDHSNPDQNTVSAKKHDLNEVRRRQKQWKDNPTDNHCLGSHDYRARYLSNHTHYSPTDPDARIAVKPGKPRNLVYNSNLSVDTANHVITNIQADHADKKDSRYLQSIVENTTNRLDKLGVKVENILADTGFSSGENYKRLEEMGIRAYIPAHGKYEGGRDGFTYEKDDDRWKCPNNKYLTFKKIKLDPKGNCFRHYRTCRMDCRDCPLKQQCIGKQHECQLRVTIYKDYYERAIKRVKCSFGRRMKYLRQSTVEPVLGSLINYYAMSSVNTRGIELAHKCMLMAAIAYNLKKYMKYSPRIINLMVGSVKTSCNRLSDGFLNAFLAIISCLMFTKIKLAISAQSDINH